MFNKTILVGRLTKDPEKRVNGETTIGKFTLATDTGYGDKKKAEFTDCVAFGKTAELICQYVKKGDPLLVEGRLQTSNWEHEGKKHYKTEVVVDKMTFLPKPKKEEKEIPTINKDDDINVNEIPF
jgi:single-strand DNA-binding protein